MTTSILQEFLRLRLLDIGPDDSRLGKLVSVADELAEKFKSNPDFALTCLLAAWDSHVGEDPALLTIGLDVESQWPTYRSAFQGEPITLYRAIALEAFYKALNLQPLLATVASNVGRNILPNLQVGKEGSILTAVMERAGELEASAVKGAWGVDLGPFTPQQVTLPKASAAKKARKEYFQAKVEGSAGPSTRAGTTLEGANTNWANAGAAWSYEYSDRMTATLLELHDSAVTVAGEVRADVDAKIVASVDSALQNLISWFVPQVQHANRMTELLWWRHALYSKSAGLPYRQLSAVQVAIHMAIDIAHLLPNVFPLAVESFLAEAFIAAQLPPAGESTKVPSATFFDMVGSTYAKYSALPDLDTTSVAGRALMLQSIGESKGGKSFKITSLGLGEDFALPLEQWSVWLLREVKALDALVEAMEQSQESTDEEGA